MKSAPSTEGTKMASNSQNTDGFRILWQSTPRLWMATRESYDGAVDAYDLYGLGRTPAEALAHLLEQELDREPA